MSNDRIPPNPYPVKPPSNMPAPRKESLEAENARLKAEVERLTKLLGMCESIDNSIDRWIESKRNAAKEGKGQP